MNSNATLMKLGGKTYNSYNNNNIPQGVLKFAVNAAIDSLPSNKNLYRWGKRMNDLDATYAKPRALCITY